MHVNSLCVVFFVVNGREFRTRIWNAKLDKNVVSMVVTCEILVHHVVNRIFSALCVDNLS